MDHILGLKCTVCGKEYGMNQIPYVCPEHGNEGIVDVVYDYGRIAQNISPLTLADNRRTSMWRYLPLMPVNPETTDHLVGDTVVGTVGWTPLYPAPRLAAALGLCHVWIKDESRQPTASLKDRASAIALIKARELSHGVITTASTGNAGAALAGLSAAVSQTAVIFVPRAAPEAKIAQLLVYGAIVLLVDGTYDDAFDLVLQVAAQFGWYNRSTAINPYMSEGKKTAAYEICEQLTARAGSGNRASWNAPDVVFVPVGDGCIIGSIHKGFSDLLALGWIDHMPRIMGVQAAGSSPLVDAWERGLDALDMKRVVAHSIADSIVGGFPRDRIKALRAVRQTGGAFLRVTDEEIIAAIAALARGCGVFAEPAAAAAYAGLAKAAKGGLVAAEDQVMVLSTGSGLKDVATAMKTVSKPPIVSHDLRDVQRVFQELGVDVR